jgi:hypothetical protein
MEKSPTATFLNVFFLYGGNRVNNIMLSHFRMKIVVFANRIMCILRINLHRKMMFEYTLSHNQQ